MRSERKRTKSIKTQAAEVYPVTPFVCEKGSSNGTDKQQMSQEAWSYKESYIEISRRLRGCYASRFCIWFLRRRWRRLDAADIDHKNVSRKERSNDVEIVVTFCAGGLLVGGFSTLISTKGATLTGFYLCCLPRHVLAFRMPDSNFFNKHLAKIVWYILRFQET